MLPVRRSNGGAPLTTPSIRGRCGRDGTYLHKFLCSSPAVHPPAPPESTAPCTVFIDSVNTGERAGMTEREPLWLQLSDRVECELRELAAGHAAPSENELAARFEVNRLTARAVLQELERRGSVRRRQGRATVVARRVEYRIGPDLVPSWTATVERAGIAARSEVTGSSVRSSREDETAELELSDGQLVREVERRRFCDGDLAAFQTEILPETRVPGLTEALRSSPSVFATLKDHYGFAPTRAWTRVEHLTAPSWVATRLGLRGRPDVVLIRGRLDCARSRRPIELTYAWLRADMFHVVVEMGRWTELPVQIPLRSVEAS